MNQTVTPPSKAPAPKAEKGEAKEKAPRRSRFADVYPDEAKIVLNVKENPKKEGSKAHARFAHYFAAKTVKEFLTLGGTYQDIAYDVGRNFVSVSK